MVALIVCLVYKYLNGLLNFWITVGDLSNIKGSLAGRMRGDIKLRGSQIDETMDRIPLLVAGFSLLAILKLKVPA